MSLPDPQRSATERLLSTLLAAATVIDSHSMPISPAAFTSARTMPARREIRVGDQEADHWGQNDLICKSELMSVNEPPAAPDGGSVCGY
jgi:hypothetical protein